MNEACVCVRESAAASLLLALADSAPVLADTIEAALVRSYQSNPQLNAQRASVHFTGENAPQALSGYRPKIAIAASAGEQYADTNSTLGGNANQFVKTEIHGLDPPRAAGLTITQTW
jgi:outer membrane protein